MGRIRATAGDLLLHPVLDCHANPMISRGVKLIRLYWPDTSAISGLYHLDDVDGIARSAEKDFRQAALFLQETLRKTCLSASRKRDDWPDLLAAALTQDTALVISDWAEANGLARETVSRGFAAAYGIAPTVFRAEWRARAAWLRIARRTDRLCTIAMETGFADQAHMTRWVHRITGAPPTAWRQARV